jgi:membrane-associated phospholipid phosphatase
MAVLAAAGMLTAQAQKTESDKAAEQQNRQAGTERKGSTLEIAPGSPTIKDKDIAHERWSAPWARLPRYVLQDQQAIWTSPFHTSKANAKWWAIFGGATAALIATDKWTSKQLPNTNDQIGVATWTSRFGAAYSLLPISGGFYVIGMKSKNRRFQEAGILGFEALADATIVNTVLKLATQRQRPLDADRNAEFWGEGAAKLNSGFPSGHAMSTWALASIVAHEYPRPLIVPILAYGFATTVCGSRFAARKHFASDVIVGAGMGWFIGDYVYAKRHNRELDARVSAFDRLRSHFHIGGPLNARQLDDPDAVREAARLGNYDNMRVR